MPHSSTPQKGLGHHRRLFYFVILFPILSFATGCSSFVNDSEAPGTYKAQMDWGTSTVVLYKSHYFEQTVTSKSGQTRHINGTWQISKSSGTPTYTTINFQPFLNVTHDKQGVYSLASMYSIYHVPFGINIAADPDYGIAHRK